MGFVHNHKVPGGKSQFFLEVFGPGKLIEAGNQQIVIVKGVAAMGKIQHLPRKKLKLQAELGRHFFMPLLAKTAGRDNENPSGIGAHEQFPDKKTGHDGLARAGVIGKDKTQGLTGQHGFIDGGDLMRQRLHVGGMHSHHGIEKVGKADATGLGGALEVVGGSVKAPGAAGFSNGNSFFVLAGEQTLAGIGAFSVFVVQGGGAGADRYQGDDFAAFALFNTGQQLPGFNIFKTQHGAPCLRAFSV